MSTDIDLRAGDTDREATAERLRRSHSEGRIDSEEFAIRIDGCYDAKTMGELGRLVADLPPEPQPREAISARRLDVGRVLPIVVAAVAVAAIAAHGGFWFVFPLLFMSRFWLGRRWPSARHRA
ncbi:MAG TPA: DUF1707 domain-containing protein [Solirubrobacteraceae bacterium]|nr:DUF1707 domain-containing protein [Solirubrobacteraceae bacterium]